MVSYPWNPLPWVPTVPSLLCTLCWSLCHGGRCSLFLLSCDPFSILVAPAIHMPYACTTQRLSWDWLPQLHSIVCNCVDVQASGNENPTIRQSLGANQFRRNSVHATIRGEPTTVQRWAHGQYHVRHSAKLGTWDALSRLQPFLRRSGILTAGRVLRRIKVTNDNLTMKNSSGNNKKQKTSKRKSVKSDGKYCEYHETTSHDTSECTVLKKLKNTKKEVERRSQRPGPRNPMMRTCSQRRSSMPL